MDAWTSRFDATAYTAASLGVPDDYIDGTTGRWSVPEEVCWGCWQRIEPPIVRLIANADCRHYHPRCLREAAFVHTGRHLRSCGSRLPFYAV